ncbi:hypothetical protein B0J17DRAFT_626003 [Rhizoctonia solani]|nr:hypothetical protein B0J17DRAFT_626003 [Rhizoctonia solani]
MTMAIGIISVEKFNESCVATYLESPPWNSSLVHYSNYALPTDEREFSRLNDQFQALKLITGSNYTAPLLQLHSGEGPKDILDIATGSGIWVIEVFKIQVSGCVTACPRTPLSTRCWHRPEQVGALRTSASLINYDFQTQTPV